MQEREKFLLFFNASCVHTLAFGPTVFQIEQGLPFNVTQTICIILLCIICHKDGISIKVF